MGGPVELKGPDLTAGAPLADIPDGGMLLGHAHGEPVIVARRGAQLFAVGATCTHYSGPLAEGLITGDKIHCPWHHACFDLRTGAPEAPAFSPIPCYRVEHKGDRVVVSDKLIPPASVKAAKPARVVIVGGGPAGALAAEALRRYGHDGTIIVVGSEPTMPIDRPNLSKDYLAGTAPEEWMELRGRDFYSEQRIDFRAGVRAIRLDLAGRAVHLDSGEPVAFDALVLATGAEPVHLELPGKEHLRYVRSLSDSKAIIAAAQGKKRAVVIGASFIGLEVAASLRTRGLEVTVVGPESHPLERVLGRELSDLIRALHEDKGVRFALGRKPAVIAADLVTLDDGERLAADLVVAGVGVRPRTELAEAAGLRVDRGVVVDADLRAAPDVYAIGDVARWPEPRSGEHVRIEHWVVARRQGEAVARTMLGRGGPYRTAPFFWSVHYDLTINYVGHAPSWDRTVIEGDLARRDAAVHYHRGGRLLAVATLGRDRYALEVARRFEAEPA
jgi:NADPH-dependent 2,4-dienoyl-CoA reductase/sulfur reductase-like enzyme/nitrite reductase/ring-hydroxylating ferredoxin subunit